MQTLCACALAVLGVLVGAAAADVVLSEGAVVEAYLRSVPTADGSALLGPVAADVLLRNFAGNARLLGADVRCARGNCTLALPGGAERVRVLALATLGNFFNHEIEAGDALEYVRVDPATGLLRRAHSFWWTRVMLADALLVLAVMMLCKNAWFQGAKAPAD